MHLLHVIIDAKTKHTDKLKTPWKLSLSLIINSTCFALTSKQIFCRRPWCSLNHHTVNALSMLLAIFVRIHQCTCSLCKLALCHPKLQAKNHRCKHKPTRRSRTYHKQKQNSTGKRADKNCLDANIRLSPGERSNMSRSQKRQICSVI